MTSAPDAELLNALDHLGACVECAALGYGGELKERLDALIHAVDAAQPGYAHHRIRESLADLVAARQLYRGGDYRAGASELVRINRRWWQAFWRSRSDAQV